MCLDWTQYPSPSYWNSTVCTVHKPLLLGWRKWPVFGSLKCLAVSWMTPVWFPAGTGSFLFPTEITLAVGPIEVIVALGPTEIAPELGPTQLSIHWVPGPHYQRKRGWEVKILLLKSKLCKATPPSGPPTLGHCMAWCFNTGVSSLHSNIVAFLKTDWRENAVAHTACVRACRIPTFWTNLSIDFYETLFESYAVGRHSQSCTL